MSRCEFDDGVELLRRSESTDLLVGAGLANEAAWRYRVFVPVDTPWRATLDQALARTPGSGQRASWRPPCRAQPLGPAPSPARVRRLVLAAARGAGRSGCSAPVPGPMVPGYATEVTDVLARALDHERNGRADLALEVLLTAQRHRPDPVVAARVMALRPSVALSRPTPEPVAFEPPRARALAPRPATCPNCLRPTSRWRRCGTGWPTPQLPARPRGSSRRTRPRPGGRHRPSHSPPSRRNRRRGTDSSGGEFAGWYSQFTPDPGRYRVGGRRNGCGLGLPMWTADSPEMFSPAGGAGRRHRGGGAGHRVPGRTPPALGQQVHPAPECCSPPTWAGTRTGPSWARRCAPSTSGWPLGHCRTTAPGMDIVPRRIDRVVETGSGDALFGWSVSTDVVREVAGDAGVVSPEFGPGDALLFDHLFLHSTCVEPDAARSGTRFAWRPGSSPRRPTPTARSRCCTGTRACRSPWTPCPRRSTPTWRC